MGLAANLPGTMTLGQLKQKLMAKGRIKKREIEKSEFKKTQLTPAQKAAKTKARNELIAKQITA